VPARSGHRDASMPSPCSVGRRRSSSSWTATALALMAWAAAVGALTAVGAGGSRAVRRLVGAGRRGDLTSHCRSSRPTGESSPRSGASPGRRRPTTAGCCAWPWRPGADRTGDRPGRSRPRTTSRSKASGVLFGWCRPPSRCSAGSSAATPRRVEPEPWPRCAPGTCAPTGGPLSSTTTDRSQSVTV